MRNGDDNNRTAPLRQWIEAAKRCIRPVKSKQTLQTTEIEWARLIFDQSVKVEVNLDGIAGVFRLPRRPFRSKATLSDHLFWHLAEGRCEGTVAGHHCRLEAGALLWVSPGESFDFAFDGSQRNTVHRFRLRVESGGRSVRLDEQFIQVPRSPALRSWFEQLIQESFIDDAHSGARTRGLVACLTGEIFRSRASTPAVTGDRQFDAAQRQRISSWLVERLGAAPEPAALARHLALSHDYFTRRFRATYGRPPRRWFVEERMRLAAHQLAETNLSVAQIATIFGFADAYFFSRQFKQVMGTGPRAYRSRSGLAADSVPRG